MKILLHVGVGNTDRPERWYGTCVILSNLARSLEALGHDCYMYCHPKAKAASIFHKHEFSVEVEPEKLEFKPDVVITWNGVSNGDLKIIEYYGRSKCCLAELGFFNHYETTYFDFSGTNCKSQNLLDSLDYDFDYESIFANLVKKYEKPQVRTDEYIFVAFQDEQDTNITQFSPFKTMDELLRWVLDLTNCYGKDVKILYKMHPKAPCKITVQDPRLEQVDGDVHSYLKNAKYVIGINSTVLFECLLYHNRIITAGLGLSSRPLSSDIDRMKYVVHCYNKQIHQTHLSDPEHIKKTWFYRTLMEKYNDK